LAFTVGLSHAPLFKNVFAPLARFGVETLTAKRAKNAKTVPENGAGHPTFL
jgi:hypothetical protein